MKKMNILILFVIVIAALSLISCGKKKDDSKPGYYLKILNPGKFPADIYLNDKKLGTLESDDFKFEMDKPAQTKEYELKIIFNSGEELIKTIVARHDTDVGPSVTIMALTLDNPHDVACLIEDGTRVYTLDAKKTKNLFFIGANKGTVNVRPKDKELEEFFSNKSYPFDLNANSPVANLKCSMTPKNVTRYIAIDNPQTKKDSYQINDNSGKNIKSGYLSGKKNENIEIGYLAGSYQVVIGDRGFIQNTTIDKYKKLSKKISYDPLEKSVFINNIRNITGVRVLVNNEAEKNISDFLPYKIYSAGDYEFKIHVPNYNYDTKTQKVSVNTKSPNEIHIDYDPLRIYEISISNPQKAEMTIRYQNERIKVRDKLWTKIFKDKEMKELRISISGEFFEEITHNFYLDTPSGKDSFTFSPLWKKGRINTTTLIAGGNLKIKDYAGKTVFDKPTIDGEIISDQLNQGHHYTVSISGLKTPKEEKIFLNKELYIFQYDPGKPVLVKLPLSDNIIQNSSFWLGNEKLNIRDGGFEIRGGKHELRVVFETGDWKQNPLELEIDVPFGNDEWQLKKLPVHYARISTNKDSEGGAEIYIESCNTYLMTPVNIPFLSPGTVEIACEFQGNSKTLYLDPAKSDILEFYFYNPKAETAYNVALEHKKSYESIPDKASEDALNELKYFKENIDKAKEFDSSMPDLWNAYLWFFLNSITASNGKTFADKARTDIYDHFIEREHQFDPWDIFVAHGYMNAIYAKYAMCIDDDLQSYKYLEKQRNILDALITADEKVGNYKKGEDYTVDEIKSYAVYSLHIATAIFNDHPASRTKYCEDLQKLTRYHTFFNRKWRDEVTKYKCQN